jgi:hypothetical protein
MGDWEELCNSHGQPNDGDSDWLIDELNRKNELYSEPDVYNNNFNETPKYNKVECEISQVEYRKYKPGRYASTTARCLKCGNTAICDGAGDGSIRACLATLRSTCPKGESNFYFAKSATVALRYKNKSNISTYEIDEEGKHKRHSLARLRDRKDEANIQKNHEPEHFSTFEEAIDWAKNNPGRTITKSPSGNGFIIKK